MNSLKMKVNNNDFFEVIDFIGRDWINSEWDKFRKRVYPFKDNKFSSEFILCEIELHPLLKIFAKYQKNLENPEIDFSKILDSYPDYKILSFLGRDIRILKSEISARGSSFRDRMRTSTDYESAKYELMVGASYKILGYQIDFLPVNKLVKTPDLLVKMDNLEFYIECKQHNRYEDDIERFKLLGNITEDLLDYFEKQKLSGYSIEITSIGKPSSDIKKLTDYIKHKIKKSEASKSSSIQIGDSQFQILISHTASHPVLIKLLKDHGHLKDKVMYTRATDLFISSDPSRNNTICIYKSVNLGKVPNNIYKLIEDANKKEINGKELLLYLDIGGGFPDWIDLLHEDISSGFKTSIGVPDNLTGIIISDVLPQRLENKTVGFKPDGLFYLRGKRSRMDKVDLKLLGMSDYTFLKVYFNQPSSN